MSKIATVIFLFLGTIKISAQNGLENIIVEKYYVSDAGDTCMNSFGGKLPIGSTTYRIYVDLLPGYRFQAAYGTPTHELFIKTSTKFFNNEDVGQTYPNIIAYRTLKKNSVMLDSWLSVGAAGEESFGVMKVEDDTLETIIHQKTMLQNKNKKAGIPLTEKDGIKFSEIGLPRPTFFKVDSAANEVFWNKTSGSLFKITNGAWACMGPGSVGLDSLNTNRVLIAQITTDGKLEFELNVQIGTPVKGVSQKYVARNPVGDEILLPSLIFNSEKKVKKTQSDKSTRKQNNP